MQVGKIYIFFDQSNYVCAEKLRWNSHFNPEVSPLVLTMGNVHNGHVTIANVHDGHHYSGENLSVSISLLNN